MMNEPMAPITVLGQFLFTEGRMFFRDKYDTLWEIRPTENRSCPLDFTILASIENEEIIQTLTRNL